MRQLQRWIKKNSLNESGGGGKRGCDGKRKLKCVDGEGKRERKEEQRERSAPTPIPPLPSPHKTNEWGSSMKRTKGGGRGKREGGCEWWGKGGVGRGRRSWEIGLCRGRREGRREVDTESEEKRIVMKEEKNKDGHAAS